MATEKQIEANRRNAKRSKGPTSDEGKRKSSRNALKHGLTAKDLLLPHENPAEFQERLEHWQGFYGSDDPDRRPSSDGPWSIPGGWTAASATRRPPSPSGSTTPSWPSTTAARPAPRNSANASSSSPSDAAPAQVHDPVVRARLEKRQADHPAPWPASSKAPSRGPTG